jgi:hypothetical protein
MIEVLENSDSIIIYTFINYYEITIFIYIQIALNVFYLKLWELSHSRWGQSPPFLLFLESFEIGQHVVHEAFAEHVCIDTLTFVIFLRYRILSIASFQICRVFWQQVVNSEQLQNVSLNGL